MSTLMLNNSFILLLGNETDFVRFWVKLEQMVQMTDGPTLTNESWTLGSGGSKKYEYIWYMKLQVKT